MSKREEQQTNKNCIPRNTLISYTEGKLSDGEMNAIEHHLSGCPMCTDELEGLKTLENPRDIDIIEQKLNMAIDCKSNISKSILHLSPLKIAASIALLISIASIIYYTSTLNTPSNQVAISMADEKTKPSDAIDSLEEPTILEETQHTTTHITSEELSMQKKGSTKPSKSDSSSKETIQPVPPPPVSTQTLYIINDDVDLDDNIELFDTEFDEHITINIIEFNHEEEEEEEIFAIVEEMPNFKDANNNKFREYITNNLKYPDIAAENGIQGKVFVAFVVEPDGSVSNVRVVRGIDPSLDKEALRVIKSSPKWIPGMQRGKPVRVSFTFPVHFSLK